MRQILLLSLTSLLVCSMASADIVGMWLFDDDDDADSSGREHDLQIWAGSSWVDGKIGKGIKFDDTGFIRIEHHEDFNFPDAYTIMIWANISNITPQEWVGIPRKENEYVLAAYKGAKVEMTMWVNVGGAWQGPIPPLGTGPQLNYGEWHHYASTYDGDTCRVYVDGEESGSQQVGGPLNETDAIVEISKSCGGLRFMEGIIDEVVMADECFTQEQIQSFMSKGAKRALSVEPRSKLAVTWGEIRSESQ